MDITPNLQLSADYKLADLCVTSQSLSAPNIPDRDGPVNNLMVTASVLEQVTGLVGPFNILSGFRTQELEDKLTAQGEPTASGISMHQMGRAVDIYPTTMSLDEFYGQLLANANLRSLFAEIAYKPSQNSIHLAVQTPDDNRDIKILGLDDAGQYVRLSLDQIQDFIAPYMTDASSVFEEASSIVLAENKLPIIIGAGALAALTFYMIMKSPKHQTA